MKCFLCQHETNEHHEGGCFANSGDHICGCMVSEVEAIHAAQRAAAIAHLRALGKEALEERECQEFLDDKSEAYMWRVSRVIDSVAAYRAVGILRERK